MPVFVGCICCSIAAADPGDDFNTGWTLIGTAGVQTFNAVTGHDGATSGSFAATDEIALNNIDARWFAIKSNSNHGATTFSGIAEVQFIEGVAVPEPATMSLLAIGGLGLLARRKRRA